MSNYAPLDDIERQALVDACQSVKVSDRGDDVVLQGEKPTNVHLLLEGFACRYKLTEDGRRQILGFLIPGDFCNLRIYILKRMDHGISALAPSRFAVLTPEAMVDLTERSTRLTRALWWSTLVDEAVALEWIVNLGQRSSHERIAHVLLETLFRQNAARAVPEFSCPFPVTQAELGDTVGLSTVHVNRTLQDLRRDRLVDIKRGVLTVLDLPRLRDLAKFSPDYLHLNADGIGRAPALPA